MRRNLKNLMSIRKFMLKSCLIIIFFLLISCFFYDTKKGNGRNGIKDKTLLKAKEAVDNENFIEAFSLYDLLLFLDKTSKEGNSDLIKLYERFREHNKAIELILNYKRLVPKDSIFDSTLGELYFTTGDYENALSYLGSGELSTLKRAICLEKTGRMTKAESLYTALVPSFNEISGYLSTRIAYCQIAKGVPESIVDLFGKLGKVIKNRDEKYIVADELLEYFVENEKYNDAFRLLSLMKEDFPEKHSILELERANIFLTMENKEKAFDLYHKIFEDAGEGAYCAGVKLLNTSKLPKREYMKLAQLCYYRKDYKNARNLLQEYVKKSDNKYALYLLGMSYYKLGQNSKTVQIFRKLKDKYPDKRQIIIYYLGRAAEKTGDYESAFH